MKPEDEALKFTSVYDAVRNSSQSQRIMKNPLRFRL
jgi:hypothetical protein